MKSIVLTLALGAFTLGGGAQAATYHSVVPATSQVGFRYQQMGVAMDGQFKQFAAQVQLDSARPAQAKGRIDIDLASIDTGSSEADDEVVGKSWFHVAAHPKGTFVLGQLKPTGTNQFEAQGQLTLKGQTRPLTVPVKLSPAGVLSGSFVLRRADFGIGQGMWAKFDVVGNEITVHFNLTLK